MSLDWTTEKMQELITRIGGKSYWQRSFTGNTCHVCKANANVVTQKDLWTCECRTVNKAELVKYAKPFKNPKYGPSIKKIREAMQLHERVANEKGK